MNTRSTLISIINELTTLESTTENGDVSASINQALYYLEKAYETAHNQ